MDRNLRSYVRVYDKLSSGLCKKIVSDLDEAGWNKHSYHNPTTGASKSYETDLSVTYDGVLLRDEVMSAIWQSLQSYMNDIRFDWFNTWNGFSPVRFNRYEVGQEMLRHCDHIHSMFDTAHSGIPTLTVLGGLNDDYEGGDLIFWGDEKIELPAGSVMVFPSNFLYPHEVKPVLSGVRYSFVSWAY